MRKRRRQKEKINNKETKSERQKDRKAERQKDRKTERQKDRKTERQKDRKTERQKDRKERERERNGDVDHFQIFKFSKLFTIGKHEQVGFTTHIPDHSRNKGICIRRFF
jgi:hypothetical protein